MQINYTTQTTTKEDKVFDLWENTCISYRDNLNNICYYWIYKWNRIRIKDRKLETENWDWYWHELNIKKILEDNRFVEVISGEIFKDRLDRFIEHLK